MRSIRVLLILLAVITFAPVLAIVGIIGFSLYLLTTLMIVIDCWLNSTDEV